MSARRIYLDHAATTPTHPEVVKEMLPYFSDRFGNASSLHREGRESVAAVDLARERVAAAIGAAPNEIYFTSCGTESDNWAVQGIAEAYAEKGKHILSSAIEHPAVLQALKRLSERGFEITYLPVNDQGFVSVEDAVSAMRKDTVLITLMLANNEVGTVQPVKEIAAEAKARGILVHTDAVQAVGSIPVNVKELGVDSLSLSAHKFYGPKGVGALYLRNGVKIKGLLLGGEQERSLRGGTYNTPAIVGLGKAIERAVSTLMEKQNKLLALKEKFVQGLSAFPCAKVNGGSPALPGTVNVRFDGVKNADLLSALDMEGIAVSLGSACSSGSVEPSHVLLAMGLTKQQVASSVRFSFGEENTLADVQDTLAALESILRRLVKTQDLFAQSKQKNYNV